MVKMMKTFAGDGDKLRAPLCLRVFVAKTNNRQLRQNAPFCWGTWIGEDYCNFR